MLRTLLQTAIVFAVLVQVSFGAELRFLKLFRAGLVCSGALKDERSTREQYLQWYRLNATKEEVLGYLALIAARAEVTAPVKVIPQTNFVRAIA